MYSFVNKSQIREVAEHVQHSWVIFALVRLNNRVSWVQPLQCIKCIFVTLFSSFYFLRIVYRPTASLSSIHVKTRFNLYVAPYRITGGYRGADFVARFPWEILYDLSSYLIAIKTIKRSHVIHALFHSQSPVFHQPPLGGNSRRRRNSSKKEAPL